MFQEFYRYCKKNRYWRPGERILLAVSGGVDSMVLMHLMQRSAEKDGFHLAIAHVNHQLRSESAKESDYLQQYCQTQGLPYYSKKWEAVDKSRNTEARARQFRYAFFTELMKKNDYSKLFTAHHKDDQAETIVMKLTRGSALANLVGIRFQQTFGEGQLIRPLLLFSKEQIERFAEQKKITYFEDSTNLSDEYVRNRMRHSVIPLLKKENQQFLQRMSDFSTQISYADELIQSVILPKYQSWVSETQEGWQIQLQELKQEEKSVQFFFIQQFLQQTLVSQKIKVSQKQVQQLLALVNDSKPQMTADLEQDWQMIKEYDIAYLRKKTLPLEKEVFSLNIGEQLFLSENEWICLEQIGADAEQPEKIRNWQELSLTISSEVLLPLSIRHRKEGDRIALTPKLTKRVKRLFIDQKIPNSIREKTWLILSSTGEIIWMPKFANSHLSIPKETDKILYRLLYKTKE
ncbi:tRNA lysidine(34) synthetase TilS [Enterococcus sp. AZ192]|uniref:tRNA lysidine(34) synthetase TilS n=1 Tax=unclassified Enterococcus TaxID=2608891 RepID=UPI003D2CD42B